MKLITVEINVTMVNTDKQRTDLYRGFNSLDSSDNIQNNPVKGSFKLEIDLHDHVMLHEDPSFRACLQKIEDKLNEVFPERTQLQTAPLYTPCVRLHPDHCDCKDCDLSIMYKEHNSTS